MLSFIRLLFDLSLLHIPAGTFSAATEGQNPEITDKVKRKWQQQYVENDVKIHNRKCLPS
jgi:hypothetical protein